MGIVAPGGNARARKSIGIHAACCLFIPLLPRGRAEGIHILSLLHCSVHPLVLFVTLDRRKSKTGG